MNKRLNNRGNRKKRWTTENLIAKLFIGFLIIMIGCNLIAPDKKISEKENRVLEQRPKVTMSGLLTGNFMKQYESYLADQFVGREFLRKIKTTISRIGGSKKEQGVLIGKDDQLFEEIAMPQPELLEKNIQSIKEFVNTHEELKVNMLLVPDTATILQDQLPAFATVEDQRAIFGRMKKALGKSVNWIDAAKTLSKHQDEKIYYKTDHHWTSLGAFYTFVDAAPSLGIKDDVSSKYVSYPVSTNFNGTLAAKSGVKMGVDEEIDIYVPQNTDNDLIVNLVEEQEKMATIYHADKLKTRDQYAVFFGGNSSVIDIKTVSQDKRRLLVIKDSYANCFVPFLTPYYREIVMVDPRYYSGNIEDILQTYKISDVLFLYSGNTFLQDNNLCGVLASGQSNENGVPNEKGTSKTK